MNKENVLEMANEGRRAIGLILLKKINFKELETVSKYGHNVFASSDDLRYISTMYGAGSTLRVWDYYVYMTEISAEVQASLSIRGRYVLWFRTDLSHSGRELVRGFKGDFTAGWRLAMAPIRAAEKAAAEAAEKAWQDVCTQVSSVFYDLEYTYWDKDQLLDVEFPKDKRFAGFYSMVKVSKLTGDDRRIRLRLSPREHSHHSTEQPDLQARGKKCYGTINPLQYARHLRIWMEHEMVEDDPAKHVYENVAAYIERRMRD